MVKSAAIASCTFLIEMLPEKYSPNSMAKVASPCTSTLKGALSPAFATATLSADFAVIQLGSTCLSAAGVIVTSMANERFAVSKPPAKASTLPASGPLAKLRSLAHSPVPPAPLSTLKRPVT